jgi:hypothetical protein
MSGTARGFAVGAAGVVLAGVVAACASGGAGPLAVPAVGQASPACSSTNLPTWSPDGKQIAFVGRRLGHGPLPQRAICIANADGKNAAPLSQTMCTRRCRLDLIDSPSQLFWVGPSLLLYGDDFRIFTIPLAGTPKPLGSQPGSFEQFSVDSAGDRVAAGYSNCPQCAGPVTVLGVPSGRLVGRIGGNKLDNITPSLSPDGTQVVFVRQYADDSGRTQGIWTASAAGTQLQRLVPKGFTPLWSPAGNRIAYLAPSGALQLVAPQGGASRTLVARSVGWLFGWSPDGRQIAFQGQGGWLDVVDVAKRKVRKLMPLRFAPNVVWSPSSQELLVKTQPLRLSRCASLWRVPAGGGKPQLLRNC